jgi:2-polyprenyl-3-methyl-5-hydroxy-6-metoxy-1,4-benzoquinol methylase
MVKKAIQAILKRWGSSSAKRRVWDSEYRTGKWSYARRGLNNEDREPIYGFLERYVADGSILDLGCGSGMTALEMKNNFAEYLGVDVSEVAIEKARAALAAETDRAGKASFAVSDIAEFEPPGSYSVILFRESIYYVPLGRIEAMLKRYAARLLPGGVILVRVCDRQKYKGIVKLLQQSFLCKEAFAASDSRMSIFVCSSR